FRSNVAIADIGAAGARQSLGVAARRRNAKEIDRRLGRNPIGDAVPHDRQPVDLFEAARAIWEKSLTCLLGGRARCDALLLPGSAIDVQRDIGQGVEAVLRT